MFSELKLQLSCMTRETSSNSISNVTTRLEKHTDDEAPFIYWNNINDQQSDGLRFKTVFSTDWEAGNTNYLQKSIITRARKQNRDQRREKESFFLMWRNKNLHPQATDNRFHCGLNDVSQTDRQNLFLPSNRPYPSSLRKFCDLMNICNYSKWWVLFSWNVVIMNQK